MYQPKAYVETHSHKVQEQVYHVLEGEGLMHIDGKDPVVRRHDFIYLPPGVSHASENTGTSDLIFLVVTSPVADEESKLLHFPCADMLRVGSRMIRYDFPYSRYFMKFLHKLN